MYVVVAGQSGKRALTVEVQEAAVSSNVNLGKLRSSNFPLFFAPPPKVTLFGLLGPKVSAGQCFCCKRERQCCKATAGSADKVTCAGQVKRQSAQLTR